MEMADAARPWAHAAGGRGERGERARRAMHTMSGRKGPRPGARKLHSIAVLPFVSALVCSIVCSTPIPHAVGNPTRYQSGAGTLRAHRCVAGTRVRFGTPRAGRQAAGWDGAGSRVGRVGRTTKASMPGQARLCRGTR